MFFLVIVRLNNIQASLFNVFARQLDGMQSFIIVQRLRNAFFHLLKTTLFSPIMFLLLHRQRTASFGRHLRRCFRHIAVLRCNSLSPHGVTQCTGYKLLWLYFLLANQQFPVSLLKR